MFYFWGCEGEGRFPATTGSPLYLDDKLAVTEKSGGVQLTPAEGREYQHVPAVMVPAECPVHQLSDGFNLTEACAPQHTLDLFRAGKREEEEQEASGTQDGCQQWSLIVDL